MSKKHEEWKKEFYKQYEETFGIPYDPNKKMTDEEREELYKDYKRVFNYDPDEEEVRKRYSAEFNEWLDNF